MTCAPRCTYPHCDCGYDHAAEASAYDAEERARAEAHLRDWQEDDEELVT